MYFPYPVTHIVRNIQTPPYFYNSTHSKHKQGCTGQYEDKPERNSLAG